MLPSLHLQDKVAAWPNLTLELKSTKSIYNDAEEEHAWYTLPHKKFTYNLCRFGTLDMGK